MPSPNVNPEFEDVSVLIKTETADAVKLIAVQNNITFEDCLIAILENGVRKLQDAKDESLSEFFGTN